jgi:hypothetical protein
MIKTPEQWTEFVRHHAEAEDMPPRTFTMELRGMTPEPDDFDAIIEALKNGKGLPVICGAILFSLIGYFFPEKIGELKNLPELNFDDEE